MKPSVILKSLSWFLLAAVCEIGGGYLIWQWLREERPAWYGLLGAGVLFAYGVVQTRQPSDFGSVYAAYGGVFIVMALLWDWLIGSRTPDRFDILGGLVALAGAAIILYAPRK
jgi:small multidrug resistance family-3 protein